MGMLIKKDHLDIRDVVPDAPLLSGRSFFGFNPAAPKKVAFRMYDDDHELYYSGIVDFDPFIYSPETDEQIERMGKWGAAYAGCTAILFKHGQGKWEQLY